MQRLVAEDDDDDNDDDDRLLDDFSGHESLSKSPYGTDVTPMTSNGHFTPGNYFIFFLTISCSVAKFRPFVESDNIIFNVVCCCQKMLATFGSR